MFGVYGVHKCSFSSIKYSFIILHLFSTVPPSLSLFLLNTLHFTIHVLVYPMWLPLWAHYCNPVLSSEFSCHHETASPFVISLPDLAQRFWCIPNLCIKIKENWAQSPSELSRLSQWNSRLVKTANHCNGFPFLLGHERNRYFIYKKFNGTWVREKLIIVFSFEVGIWDFTDYIIIFILCR